MTDDWCNPAVNLMQTAAKWFDVNPSVSNSSTGTGGSRTRPYRITFPGHWLCNTFCGEYRTMTTSTDCPSADNYGCSECIDRPSTSATGLKNAQDIRCAVQASSGASASDMLDLIISFADTFVIPNFNRLYLICNECCYVELES